MNKLNSINRFKLIFVVSCIILVGSWVAGICTNGRDSVQMNTFFLKTADFWGDFSNPVAVTYDRDPYRIETYIGFSNQSQPPLAYVFFYPFTKLIPREVIDQEIFGYMYIEPLYTVMILIFISFSFVLAYKLFEYNLDENDKKMKFFESVVFLFSFPVIFSVERGNHVWFAFLLFFFFLSFYDSENKILKELSLLALAVAAGLKITPAFGGIILLSEKKWKESIRCIIYGVLCFFIPFLFFKGGFENISYFLKNLQLYAQCKDVYKGIAFSSCLKFFFNDLIKIDIFNDSVYIFAKYSNYIYCVFMAISCFFLNKKWHKYLTVALIIISIQGFTAEYCLLYLIPSFILFINDENKGIFDYVILYFIILVLKPFQFFVFNSFFDFKLSLLFFSGLVAYFSLSNLSNNISNFVRKKKDIGNENEK